MLCIGCVGLSGLYSDFFYIAGFLSYKWGIYIVMNLRLVVFQAVVLFTNDHVNRSLKLYQEALSL